MSQFITYHGVDDERIEQIEQRELARKPMRGGRQALEDVALARYFEVLDDTGDQEKAQKAFFETFKPNHNEISACKNTRKIFRVGKGDPSLSRTCEL